MNVSSNSRPVTVRDEAAEGDVRRVRRHPVLRFLGWCLLLAFLLVGAWTCWVVHEINRVAGMDEARPSDAIAVFGAAEYAGRPSPVFHARLDHAVALYERQVAPMIITLGGGADRDSGKTEGGVGRDYLLARGVPFDKIVAETHSVDTEEQVALLAEIAQERGLEHVVVVSDNTHLFRIQKLCEDAGLTVYTSPRPALGHIDSYDLGMRYLHEVVQYTAMELGVNEGWLRGWVDGRE